MSSRVYLDHLGTTPLAPSVWAEMQPWLTDFFGNPSGLHQEALLAREAVAKARSRLASFVNALSAEEILFVGSGTEALNLGFTGAALAAQSRGKHLVIGATEHPAIFGAAEALCAQGFSCTRVPVDSLGFIDPAAVLAAITEHTTVVAVHLANHDTGTVQPIAEIANGLRNHPASLVVDATAAAGWISVDVQKLGAAVMMLSPHRFHGPPGVGILYRRRGTRLAPLFFGGQQEFGLRPGTENVAAIVGAGAAAELATQRLMNSRDQWTKELQELWLAIEEAVSPVVLHGPLPGPNRLPRLLNFSLPKVEGEGLALALDLKGFAVASGAACVSKSMRMPPVLAAMGVDLALGKSNLIISLGADSTSAQLASFVKALTTVVERFRAF